jgi:hypothetical protein
MPPPDPGWYPDPQNGTLARWWDGTQWTSATQNVVTLQAQSTFLLPRKPRRRIDDNFARLAIVVQLLLLVTVLSHAAIIWGNLFIIDWAEDVIAGRPVFDDAEQVDRINVVSGIGYFLLILITGIAFIRWLFVAHSSDRVNPDAVKHKSGWAIGGWFVPILSLWRPFGVTIDVRRGILGPGATATALMWCWWLAFCGSLIASRVAAGYYNAIDSEELVEFGEQFRLSAQAQITSSVIDIAAAVLAILVVRHLTRLVRDAPVVS